MYVLTVDGSCVPKNPGMMRTGFVIHDSVTGEFLHSATNFYDEGTNNVAEYLAVIDALNVCLERGYDDLEVWSDSQLVVRQLSGVYKVKSIELKRHYDAAKDLISKFKSVRIRWQNRGNGFAPVADAASKNAKPEDIKAIWQEKWDAGSGRRDKPKQGTGSKAS